MLYARFLRGSMETQLLRNKLFNDPKDIVCRFAFCVSFFFFPVSH